jgi:hypothetical protein
LGSSTFRRAKASLAFVGFEAPSVVAIVFLVLLFVEVPAGSDSMLPGGCLFCQALSVPGAAGMEPLFLPRRD